MKHKIDAILIIDRISILRLEKIVKLVFLSLYIIHNDGIKSYIGK